MEFRPLIEKISVFFIVLTFGAHAYGQTNAIATGNWSDPLTWSGGEPTATSDARVNGGFTVTIDQSGETTQLLTLAASRARRER